MQKSISKRLLLNGFWLSVLLHVLLLLAFTTIIVFPPEKKQKTPNLFVPSYVYKGKILPSTARPSSPSVASAQSQPQTRNASSLPSTPSPLHIPRPQKQTASEKPPVNHKSIMSATREMLATSQRNMLSSNKETNPIYMVGDDNDISDPLIRLMGQALSMYFSYPQTAGELGIKGRVLIGLTLHPEGYFSDVQMLRSSTNNDLDSAALYAVNKAPTVYGADRFISQPKHFVVGFIFK